MEVIVCLSACLIRDGLFILVLHYVNTPEVKEEQKRRKIGNTETYVNFLIKVNCGKLLDLLRTLFQRALLLSCIYQHVTYVTL